MERGPRREAAGETRSTKERGSEMMRKEYRQGKLSYNEFLVAAKRAISDFDAGKLARGEYSHDQMNSIDNAVRDAIAAKERRPASAPAPAPRPAPRTPETPSTGRPPERADLARANRSDEQNGGLGSVALGAAVAAGATAVAVASIMGAGTGAVPAGEAPAATQQEEADAAAEAQEAGESFDISDDYRNRFADETGNNTNPKKQESWDFGEAYEYTTPEAFKKEVRDVAMHEKVMFSAWYYDLDDSDKVPGTENMSIAELQQAMMENEDLHKQMVEKFIEKTEESTTTFEEDTVTGRYTNVYARTTGGNGEQITSDNTEAVHCETNEENTKVVVMSYKTADGKMATITFREACGLQNIRLVGTPESDKIVTSTPEVETPSPDKPDNPKPDNPKPDNPKPDNPDKPDQPETPEPTPPPEDKGKKKFDEDELFRDDDAGDKDAWEKDDKAITEETKTKKPSTPKKEDFHEDTGNYEEQKPASKESQHAEQKTSERKKESEQKSDAAEKKAQDTQKKANEGAKKANEAAEKHSHEETKKEVKEQQKKNNDDGHGDFADKEAIPW